MRGFVLIEYARLLLTIKITSVSHYGGQFLELLQAGHGYFFVVSVC